ncbi:MAG TPA: imidazole glycerol phosphate synthase subunit HisH [Armatimonadota bacterium]|nr:imidazole glycerol phosphate synthase subunit HisH [Armatimonadota bacterium]
MIAIVDYGMGNLRSVQKALEKLGYPAVVTAEPEEIARAEKVVLPGVGAFGAAMHNLERAGLKESVLAAIHSGRPFLGICLGLQLLFSESEEMGNFTGLDVVPGRVIRFPEEMRIEDRLLKIPHIGWNALRPHADSRLFQGIPAGSRVYFVHSFYGAPTDPAWVAASSDYGIEFCAAVERGNVFATQFHPEKSGAVGLRILRNFAAV